VEVRGLKYGIAWGKSADMGNIGLKYKEGFSLVFLRFIQTLMMVNAEGD